MMMPSISSPSYYSGCASSASLVVRVEKATSEFLIGPDWTMNIDICDTINTNQWLIKDVIKAVKKRLQHKNPKVQLLALTLLETMVKNCGDFVHFQIADRNILQEMVKIVKKKTDMHVRDKILVLLNSWQEAFGGPGGKYPQYYWAYEELRRSGLEFPQRSFDTAPIFTPPMTQPTPRNTQPGYAMPSNSSMRLDEAMAADMESLSLSSINSMRDFLDLLADMLQAVNPNDRLAVKDEVIVDLVDRCRSNQKKLMQMLTTTGDEELLGQGLELNDNLQTVLAKHDAIASGLPLPIQVTDVNSQSSEIHGSSLKPADTKTPISIADGNLSAPAHPLARSDQFDKDEEEEDDFAQLARRHSKTRPSASQAVSSQSSDGGTKMISNSNMTPQDASSTPVTSNALVPFDPPAPVSTMEEQHIIDLLSITLSTSLSSAQTPQAPASATQNLYQGSSPSMQENNLYAPQAHIGGHGQTYNSYITPWAQHQPQPQAEPESQPQIARNPVQPHPLHNTEYYSKSQPHLKLQPQPHLQLQSCQYSTGYPPPPWAATPGYISNPNPLSRSSYAYSITQSTSTTTPMPSHGTRRFQHTNSFPGMGGNGEVRVSSIPGSVAPSAEQKPFIPSYRLFEDLNVLGNTGWKI